MSLLNTIKTAGMQSLDASKPAAIMFGEVLSINPLSVNVDQRLTLDADFLIVPESLTRYEVNVASQTVVIRPGLSVGDKLLLLRMQGGQKYVLLDKVVDSG